ncbi:SPOR domain-containing protein [Desulfosporosinus shakirovi]|uniref:SPOR domain-containing protein n=1 Tax=Desulfosporosinus shakirovi TaxID=2885154 RepID=UPI001E5646BC|nr:SPOR domain-containing protein [Desulfosporosinus sp. SRJS8]MCB8817634.1 SPOR domain-containing protein [Desulfosporosinus sp. SRJS8]
MKIVDRLRVGLVLILGIMALALLTWGIGKIYLELIGQSSREHTVSVKQDQTLDQTDQETILVLPEIRFWTCQAGLFQQEHNAQLLKDQLTVMGFKAEVISANPWMVGIGLRHSANELKELRQLLEEKGFSTIPKQIQLPERSFRVAGNGAQLTAELLKNVHSILEKGFNQQLLAKEEQLWMTQAGKHPPKDLEGLHQLYNQIRTENKPKEQEVIGLSLFFESQRVINKFSGK